MAAFLQINTNRSREAQALALNTMKELEADILSISEPNKVPDQPGWVGSTDGKCALYSQQHVEVLRTGTGVGFAWVDLETYSVYSCYISPNCRFKEFIDFLNKLEHSIKLASREIILSGDFNAHAQAWGSKRMDPRGEALLEMTESLGLIPANYGQVPTFPRSESFLDLTFATRGPPEFSVEGKS